MSDQRSCNGISRHATHRDDVRRNPSLHVALGSCVEFLLRNNDALVIGRRTLVSMCVQSDSKNSCSIQPEDDCEDSENNSRLPRQSHDRFVGGYEQCALGKRIHKKLAEFQFAPIRIEDGRGGIDRE